MAADSATESPVITYQMTRRHIRRPECPSAEPHTSQRSAWPSCTGNTKHNISSVARQYGG